MDNNEASAIKTTEVVSNCRYVRLSRREGFCSIDIASPALEDINRVCVEAFDQAEGKQYSFLDDYTEERSV